MTPNMKKDSNTRKKINLLETLKVYMDSKNSKIQIRSSSTNSKTCGHIYQNIADVIFSVYSILCEQSGYKENVGHMHFSGGTE